VHVRSPRARGVVPLLIFLAASCCRDLILRPVKTRASPRAFLAIVNLGMRKLMSRDAQVQILQVAVHSTLYATLPERLRGQPRMHFVLFQPDLI